MLSSANSWLISARSSEAWLASSSISARSTRFDGEEASEAGERGEIGVEVREEGEAKAGEAGHLEPRGEFG